MEEWKTGSRRQPNWTGKRKKKNEELRDLSDNFKQNNIHIIGVPEGEQRWRETENLVEEVIIENFPNLRKETDIQVLKHRKPQTSWMRGHPPQGTQRLKIES